MLKGIFMWATIDSCPSESKKAFHFINVSLDRTEHKQTQEKIQEKAKNLKLQFQIQFQEFSSKGEILIFFTAPLTSKEDTRWSLFCKLLSGSRYYSSSPLGPWSNLHFFPPSDGRWNYLKCLLRKRERKRVSALMGKSFSGTATGSETVDAYLMHCVKDLRFDSQYPQFCGWDILFYLLYARRRK